MDYYTLLLFIATMIFAASTITVIIKIKNQQIKKLLKQKHIINDAYQKERENVVRLETIYQSLQHKINDEEKNHNTLKQQFENLANDIFDRKNQLFRQETKYNLDNIITPLKENIDEFRITISEGLHRQNKEQFSLKNEISKIVFASEKMNQTTVELTNALKNDSKIQGNWGEIILERILEESGLREGHEYIVQAKGMGIKDCDSGRTLKPDVIINLPDNKHIVIDAKVSLTHYEAYRNAEKDQNKQLLLKKMIESIKNHINELSSKTYHNSEKLSTPEMTVMFMPIENALALAMQEERKLFDYAWQKHIIIVSPTILFATLRTISSIWVTQRGNLNAAKIVKQGGALYDKIVSFTEDMLKIGQTIDTTRDIYDRAMIKLKGKGNLIRKAQELSELGIRKKKELPDIFKE